MTELTRPVAVDTELARIWTARADAADTLTRRMDSLHYRLNERRNTWSRNASWPTTDAEAEAALRAKVADGSLPRWDQDPAEKSLAEIDALRATIAALNTEAAPLNDEYETERWPRFFLVTNSNGHIHRSMNCATTFPTTRWAWLPDQSGLTEADAVAAHGPRLCSVCYPSAPVEWTLGLPKAAKCAGSGVRVDGGRYRYGKCPVCGNSYKVSNVGAIRAHKPAKETA